MAAASESSDSSSVATGEASFLLELPVELLYLVCDHLPPYGIVVLSQTCAPFRHVLDDELLWRSVFTRTFGTPIPPHVLDAALGSLPPTPAAQAAPSGLVCVARDITLKAVRRQNPRFVAGWRAWGQARASEAAALRARERGDVRGALVGFVESAWALWWGGHALAAWEVAEQAVDAAAACSDSDVAADLALIAAAPQATWLIGSLPFEQPSAPGVVADDEPLFSIELAARVIAGYALRDAGVEHAADAACLLAGALRAPAPGTYPKWLVTLGHSMLSTAAQRCSRADMHAVAIELYRLQIELASTAPSTAVSVHTAHLMLAQELMHVGDYADAGHEFAVYARSGEADRIAYTSPTFWALATLATAAGDSLDAAHHMLGEFTAEDPRFFETPVHSATVQILWALRDGAPDDVEHWWPQAFHGRAPALQLVLAAVAAVFLPPGSLRGLVGGSSEYEYDASSDGE